MITTEELSALLFDVQASEDGSVSFKNKEHPNRNIVVLDASMGGDKAEEDFHKKAIPGARFLDTQRKLLGKICYHLFDF